MFAPFVNMKPETKRSGFQAFLGQRCPRCREGKIFRNLIDGNKCCPVCELAFEREPGYFIGSMYFSYALAIPVICLFMLLWYLVLPELGLWWLAVLAVVTFIPLVPTIYRYSRVIWLYFDRWAWPESSFVISAMLTLLK